MNLNLWFFDIHHFGFHSIENMSADEERKTEQETLIRYPLRKKPRMQENKTDTSQPRILTKDQWRELDRLDKEYSSDEWAGCKWVRIEAQMHTSFANLDVKRSSLMGICKRARKQREIQELVRCKEQHEDCQTTITQLHEEANQVIREKEALTVVSEEWRTRSKKLMEEVQLLKKELAEAEKKIKKQSKYNVKIKEDTEAQVKTWKRKFEITNTLLKTEKETSEFLRQAMDQE